MSDLAGLEKLMRSNAQLPVNVYFDQDLLAQETAKLFKQGPRYAGHTLMVPNEGDYATLPWENDGRVLVRNAQGLELISNVCRHRQAKMLSGRGNATNIICPLHRWTYDLKGELIGAPHFADTPCMNLNRFGLQHWNGLLFDQNGFDVPNMLQSMVAARDLNFDGYMLDRVEVEEYACNWKTFIEVYLEDYHVEPFHPGLGQFVNVSDLRWEFGDWYSVQTCGIKNGLARPGSAVYGRWHDQVLRYGEGKAPSHGAIWLTYFPNIMVEWYPHVLVISAVIPRGPEACSNIIEFYYPEDIALFEREFVEAEQAAYRETAVEDAEIIARMTEGRRALWLQGRNEAGPYQSPLEDGMVHFHEFLRREVAPHI